MAEEGTDVAKNNKKQLPKVGSGFLTRLLLLLLLVSVGYQLLRIHHLVEEARVQQQDLTEQVEAQQQANDALRADIAEGDSQEKMKELARDELGLVAPGERVFYVN